MNCTICGNTNTVIKDYNNKFIIKGKDISFECKRRFCSKCNNLIYDEFLDNKASLEAIKIYNKLYGIPSEDIINFRKKYNLSLDELSKIIGCAKKTLISYEKGTSIPNDVYTITINNLLKDSNIINSYLENNKNRLSENDFQKINKKIKKYNSNNINKILESDSVDLNIPNEYNGYSFLSMEKVKNLVLFLSEDGISKTKLLKEMFYSDFLNFKNTTTSITGLEYVKLPFGPVPDDFESIIRFLYNSGLITYDVKTFDDSDFELHLIKSNENYDLSIFDKDEIKLIKFIKKYFQDFSVNKIVSMAHNEKAYQNTEFKEKINYEYAFDIDLK